MNILFFLEPSIELGNPEFRYATLRSAIVPQVAALHKVGVRTHTVTSTVIAERAMNDGHLGALQSVSTLDPLNWTEGENTLERSLRHQAKIFNKGEIERLSTLVKADLPSDFSPDIVIVWEAAVSWLSHAFPNARVIYQMPGFFSRAPFPQLIAFDSGLLAQTANIQDLTLSHKDATSIQDLRMYERRFLSSVSPIHETLLALKERFKKIILLPLQIDGYFMIDSILERRSQFDVLTEILKRTPKHHAIIVTNYRSPQTNSQVLTEHNVKYLRSRFPNFCYFEKLDKIPSVSQFIVPEADGVITVSSSLGYQAAFWQKPLITFGKSHISAFSSAQEWEDFSVQVDGGYSIDRDALIASLIKTRHLPAKLLSEDGERYATWLRQTILAPEGVFPAWTTDQESIGDLLKSMRQEPELLKQLGYFNRTREESSMYHCRELSQQIHRYPIISFDIFDTLLYRPFKSPSEMFDFITEKVRQLCNMPSLNFKEARRSAERNAFEKAIENGFGETTIDDIYIEFSGQQNISLETAKKVQELEMQVEMDILYPRSSGFKAFNEARSLGKRVILISDMYLPKDFLETILKKNGFTGYEHFYLSSEVKLKKHNGKLFDFVIEDLGVDPTTILHIGDNLAADVIKAKERGIKPFHLVKASEVFSTTDAYNLPWLRDEDRHSLDWKMILAVAGNRFHDNPYLPQRRGTLFSGDAWRLGYYGQGPLLLAYTKWLIEQSIRDGVKRLYFLSRDGLIMKESYDRLAKNYDKAPSSHYLLCSRRAVNLAKIKDAHGVMDLLHVDYARTTIQHLLSSRFGVYVASIPTETLKKHNFSLDSIVTQRHIELLKPLLLDLLPLILEAAKIERDNYLEYLESTGLLNEDQASVVDIGYAGTMQESLFLLNEKRKLFGGYYLMTFRQAIKRVDNYGMSIKGFLGNFVDRHDTHNPFCNHIPLYETLFSSEDTSFIRMDRDWKGRLSPVFMDRMEGEAKREQIVHRIHRGSLAFIDDISQIFGRHFRQLDIEPNKSMRILATFFTQPHPVDARIFSGIVFEDAYGGAGLKTILPENDNLESNCVWKKGAEVIKAAMPTAQQANAQTAKTDKSANQVVFEPPYAQVFDKIEHRIIRWVVRKTSNDKKFRKFEHTPVKFFADSKTKHVRLLGKIYMSRS
ncbi:HAD-IA family hydrolase [Pseudomonas sp. TMW 2.1634]|uniref:HAD family hydrolase n=1 Tax=Pseudomonas sp. TMW 2.1634 TaxID=1886807 RepID=UPI000E75899D|nr:HAD-IA family hydrolase [Pseudomonas sp. TMW 2.1634]AOA09168.1 hypothetical protein BFC21_25430 [Pseudomonas sp. TMW 2.1634]